ncbi:TPA: hypothetical protein N0F65_005367 [Lagenidium giganteum]|uniref:Alpha/beta hydrolase fold-3 domain-containing protein n=1 Tax=Lagenidium giganteum TaxID=4803 RepID=A0AAV2YPR0_9STRA|nr:TPA: hypothetical protein N0F65_005367 [Lagenidium giganteum]
MKTKRSVLVFLAVCLAVRGVHEAARPFCDSYRELVVLLMHVWVILWRTVCQYIARGCRPRHPGWTFLLECTQQVAFGIGSRYGHHLGCIRKAGLFRHNTARLGRWMARVACVQHRTEVEVFHHMGLEHLWLRAKRRQSQTSTNKSPLLVVYYHGGGYSLLSPWFYVFFVTRLIDHLRRELGDDTDVQIVLPNFRKLPEHPLHAVVDDAMAMYHYIVETSGVSTDSVVVAGDSAGAGLVVSTLLGLRDEIKQPTTTGHDMPVAGICGCPLFDLLGRRDDRAKCILSDQLLDVLGQFAEPDSMTAQQAAAVKRLANLADCELHDLPPLLIQVAEFDVVRKHGLVVAEKARAAGVDVTLEEHADMPHTFFLFPTFMLPKSRDGIQSMAKFAVDHFRRRKATAQAAPAC